DPLADVPGGLFDDAVLQRGGLIHAELEVALGMIRPPLEGGAEHVLERPVREPEALEEELPGVGDVHPRHRTRASRDRPPACAPRGAAARKTAWTAATKRCHNFVLTRAPRPSCRPIAPTITIAERWRACSRYSIVPGRSSSCRTTTPTPTRWRAPRRSSTWWA